VQQQQHQQHQQQQRRSTRHHMEEHQHESKCSNPDMQHQHQEPGGWDELTVFITPELRSVCLACCPVNNPLRQVFAPQLPLNVPLMDSKVVRLW
jgi:hypothetical protein